MSITREQFLEGLKEGNVGYYESVLRLTQRVNTELVAKNVDVNDGASSEVIVHNFSMRKQIRVDRVTGEIEHIITSDRGEQKYRDLVTSRWYVEAFGLDKEPNKLRVNIKEVDIDKIPDKFIVSVYYCYLNYYDCITYNDTAGMLDKRVESDQRKARHLFKELQEVSEDFDHIILDVMDGKYDYIRKQEQTLENPKRSFLNRIKERLLRK